MQSDSLYRPRIVMAYVSGLAIVLGFALVVLDITGVIEWHATLPQSEFRVSSTHIGIGFALVGLSLGIFVILRPARQEITIKRTAEPSILYSASPSRRTAAFTTSHLSSPPLPAAFSEMLRSADLSGSVGKPTPDQTKLMQHLFANSESPTTELWQSMQNIFPNDSSLRDINMSLPDPPVRESYEFKSVSRSECRS